MKNVNANANARNTHRNNGARRPFTANRAVHIPRKADPMEFVLNGFRDEFYRILALGSYQKIKDALCVYLPKIRDLSNQPHWLLAKISDGLKSLPDTVIQCICHDVFPYQFAEAQALYEESTSVSCRALRAIKADRQLEKEANHLYSAWDEFMTGAFGRSPFWNMVKNLFQRVQYKESVPMLEKAISHLSALSAWKSSWKEPDNKLQEKLKTENRRAAKKVKLDTSNKVIVKEETFLEHIAKKLGTTLSMVRFVLHEKLGYTPSEKELDDELVEMAQNQRQLELTTILTTENSSVN
jgi:hypothetical protein